MSLRTILLPWIAGGDADKALCKAANSLDRYVVRALEKGAGYRPVITVGRWTQLRMWYNTYRVLLTIVIALNLTGLVLACADRFAYADENAAAITLGNILVATAVRNELFLRIVFCICVKAFRKWTPLWWRLFLTAFLQHLGGIHSGSAVSGLAWSVYTTVRLFQCSFVTLPLSPASAATLAWGVITSVIILVIVTTALPLVREVHHNVFERFHRFAGWFSLACVWIFVLLSACLDPTTGTMHGAGRGLMRSLEFWFACAITILIFVPWFTVRNVPVEITTPSPSVSIVKFDRGVQQGLLGRISRNVAVEYHGFGIVSEGVNSGCHYMVVGVQGDWTRRISTDPPATLYTREMKFAGLPYLAHLYKSGICICTGSGIGAVLSTCLQLDNWFLIWIGANMEETFGPVMFDMIRRRIPQERFILFDTRKEGRRPDTVRLLKDTYAAIKAEVVIITSNRQGTADLMRSCSENGMHAFGPLWDS